MRWTGRRNQGERVTAVSSGRIRERGELDAGEGELPGGPMYERAELPGGRMYQGQADAWRCIQHTGGGQVIVSASAVGPGASLTIRGRERGNGRHADREAGS